MDLKRYQQLKAEVEHAQRDKDRAEGALQQLMGRLNDEFDCDSLEKAEKLLTKLRKDQERAERQFDAALEKFESDWGDKVKGE